MRVLRLLYTGYGLGVFSVLFLVFFFPLLVPILFPKQYHLVGVFNRWWARTLFAAMGMPWSLQYLSPLDRNRQYIFCPNHFSYADIPVMGLNHHNTVFVGKNDMENIPLFGFMYRKLHITVDRSKLKSRFNTYLRSCKAIDEGKSLVIFPEGGMVATKEPIMGIFKDGAFRTAIEKQIPIVPVTLPYNWILLPPDEFLVRWHRIKAIYHEPIETTGLRPSDANRLKDKVYSIIEQELKRHIV